MDEFDQAYGHAPDEFDQAYQPDHDEFDKAYAAADGTAAGQAAGDALARLQQGEVKSAPADWGDVGTSALKVLLGQDDYSQQLLGKPGLSPQEKEAYYGTVLPTAIVGGSLLAGGPGAGLVAREALGLTTGAASRAAIAKARGDDPFDAATGYDRQTGEIHPAGPLIDAGMSALPEAWSLAKMAGNALPSAVQAPFRAAGSEIASGVGKLATGAVDAIASRYPGFGEKLVDDSHGFGLSDIFDRPPIREPDAADFAREIEPGHPSAALSRPSGLQQIKEAAWQPPVRALLESNDLVENAAGRLVDRARQIRNSLQATVGAQGRAAISDIAPGEESAAIARALDTGSGLNVTAPGLPGSPEVAGKARALQGVFADMNAARTDPSMGGVWDKVPAERWDQLSEQGVPHEDIRGQAYMPAQTTEAFWPHRSVTDPSAPAGQLPAITQIMADNPELNARQAMRRLAGMATGSTTGFARTSEPMGDISLAVHDVVPSYLNQEIPRIANAAVFGGRPVEVTIPTQQGIRPVAVGHKAASYLEHFLNTGNHTAARNFSNALADLYAPSAGYGSEVKQTFAQGVSDMALSHSYLTHLPQVATPLAMSGGPKQLARGIADVRANPILKEIFAAGPQTADYADYMNLARGSEAQAPTVLSKIKTPMQALTGMQKFVRGPASYAAVPFIQDTAKEAASNVAQGLEHSAALTKKAAEMGTTPDYLANELRQNGTLTPGTWLNSIQNLVDRWQHVTGPGQLPTGLKSPLGALVGQYKTYGMKQSQLVMDDVIRPIMLGDPSLRWLGLKRAMDLGIYSGGTSLANAIPRAIVRGQVPTLSGMLRQAVTGPTGIGGEALYGAANRFAPPKYRDDTLTHLSEIPAASVPIQAFEHIAAGGYRPGPAIASALQAAGAIDPRIPMYGTLPLAAMRRFAP